MADAAVKERARAAQGQPAATQFVQVLALGVDPQWRRLSQAERSDHARRFEKAVNATAERDIATECYSMVGMRAGCDIVLWRVADTFETLEAGSAALLRTEFGSWCSVYRSMIGMTAHSTYLKKPSPQDQGFGGRPDRYLIAYPFTKTPEWYLLPKEQRQDVMNEHMRVGHRFPQVRQFLAYSTGIDDQEFIVAYQTNDLPIFGELVRALRATESRRSTVSDTPVLTGVHRDIHEVFELLGAFDD